MRTARINHEEGHREQGTGRVCGAAFRPYVRAEARTTNPLFPLLLCVGLLTPIALAAERRDVLAHGLDAASGKQSPAWVMAVDSKDNTAATTVLYCENYVESKWQEMPGIPARVIGATSYRGDLVLLLENRTWLFSASTGSSRFSYGLPLPDRARIVALAGDRNGLWALGRPEIVATRPATTQSATSPSRPEGMTLYALTGGKWKPLEAEWPERLPPSGPHMLSLAVVNGTVMLAVCPGDRYVRVYEFTESGGWSQANSMRLDAAPRQIKLLDLRDTAGLWVLGEQGAGVIHKGEKLMPLALGGPAPAETDLDVTVVGDQIRAYFRRDGKLHEQSYNLDGMAKGEPAAMAWTRPSTQPQVQWFTMVAMAVMVVLVISTMMRKRTAEKRDEDKDDGEE